jgi:hypothetical protein
MTAWKPPAELGPPPLGASWPRLASGAHPDAVGSYGPEMLEWCTARKLHPKRSSGWRWWQRYVAWRALEHDARGSLVWDTVLLSGPRQIGKSWLERGLCSWRIEQSERWGEEQALLHVAHKLIAAQEVWRPAARWAVGEYGRGSVRWANGEQQIETPDGGRWMIQAASDGAGVAFTLSMALVDEAWRIPRQVVDAAISPTMAEAESPQLWLVSTAGDSTSDLMATNRAAGLAMAEMGDPGRLLLMEWSAPPEPELDLDDPKVWRMASPHWDKRREERVARARGRSMDALGEYTFRQQWLNQWIPSARSALIEPRAWAASSAPEAAPLGEICFGFDVAVDRSAAAVVACGGGVLEVIKAEPGVGWLEAEILGLVERWNPPMVVADPGGPAVTAVNALGPELGDRLRAVKARELVAACAEMFDALEPGGLAHRPHPALDGAVANAGRRATSGAWVFDRAAPGGHVLIAAALAAWADHHPVVSLEEAPAVW